MLKEVNSNCNSSGLADNSSVENGLESESDDSSDEPSSKSLASF